MTLPYGAWSLMGQMETSQGDQCMVPCGQGAGKMDCMGAGEAAHRGCSMQGTAHTVTEGLREQRGDTEATRVVRGCHPPRQASRQGSDLGKPSPMGTGAFEKGVL